VVHVLEGTQFGLHNTLPYISTTKFASITASIRAREKSFLSSGAAPKAAIRSSSFGRLVPRAACFRNG
jgi:hypothetical protein